MFLRRQGLGEAICDHFCCQDPLDFYVPSLNLLAEPTLMNVNMLQGSLKFPTCACRRTRRSSISLPVRAACSSGICSRWRSAAGRAAKSPVSRARTRLISRPTKPCSRTCARTVTNRQSFIFLQIKRWTKRWRLH